MLFGAVSATIYSPQITFKLPLGHIIIQFDLFNEFLSGFEGLQHQACFDL